MFTCLNFVDAIILSISSQNSLSSPFTNPNTTLQYIHGDSNQPPITTKNIPAGINKRLSYLLSDKASSTKPLSIPKSTRRMRIPGYTVHYEPLTTNKLKNRQRNHILRYTTLIQQNREHQHRTQIPHPSRQALP